MISSRLLRQSATDPLWIGTSTNGLARLDKDGRWQTYSAASTNGGLPDDDILALAPSADGVLSVGTWANGLALLNRDGHAAQ